MANIRRLVLDTLKPHEPNIIELAQVLGSLEGISAPTTTERMISWVRLHARCGR